MFLNCHTAFSFKYGTLTIDRLFKEARRCGVNKLILTEINKTASYIEMLRLCRQYHPSSPTAGEVSHELSIGVGIEFRRDHELLYIAIAKNTDGFANINRFLSKINLHGKNLPLHAPELENVFIIYPFGKVAPETLRGWEYIGVRKHQLTQFSLYEYREDFEHKFVIHHPVTFANKIDFNVHRLLLAIDHNTLLSKLLPLLQAHPEEVMVPGEELKSYFSNYPALIKNTNYILENSTLDIPLGTDKNKKYFTINAASDLELLTAETWKGFYTRYSSVTNTLKERVERELRIIQQKGFCSYFLIAYDLICFANTKGFDFVGRGSGANSVVAYCLGITNVDPIELDLYFERFLNPERTSPPDFDIDFSWDNRDEVYNYIFNKYGSDYTCLLGTHVTYQKRSVIRELGKVFGLPKDEINALVEEPLRHKEKDHITSLIFRYAEHLKDLPSNMSIHAGGILITDNPIFNYTAVDLPPKGYPVSHIEMHNAEDMGIFKFDVLSQRGLGHIKETVKLVKKNKGVDVDVHQFRKFKHDEKVKTLLRDSRAMGCFYVDEEWRHGDSQ